MCVGGGGLKNGHINRMLTFFLSFFNAGQPLSQCCPAMPVCVGGGGGGVAVLKNAHITRMLT